MFKHHFKVALRNIRKDKLYAFINVIGLALGLACTLLIGQFIWNELNYDHYHTKADQISRIHYELISENDQTHLAQTPTVLATYLAENYPEILESVRITKNNAIIKKGEERLDKSVLVTEPSFFEIFDVDVIARNTDSFLSDPSQILITESFSRLYFGDEDPVGQSMEVKISDKEILFTVAGLLKDPPVNTNIPYEIIVSYNALYPLDDADFRGNNWGTFSTRTYLLLNESTNTENLEQKITEGLRTDLEERFFGNNKAHLTPIKQVHLATHVSGALVPPRDTNNLWILGGIAFFILMIACFNFVTLSLGRSGRRLKEIGVRKVAGGSSKEIIQQQFGETFVLVVLGLIVGIGLAEFMSPSFGEFVSQDIRIMTLLSVNGLVALGVLTILVTFLSGIYPAQILARFNPGEILQQKMNVKGRPVLVKSLVSLQFFVALLLITGTLTIHNQLNFVSSSDPGFDTENIVVLDVPPNRGRDIMDHLKNVSQGTTLFDNVSGSWNKLPSPPSIFNGIDATWKDQAIPAFAFNTHPDIFETIGLEFSQLPQGKEKLQNLKPGEVFINEAMARSFNWENPIGETISMFFTVNNAEIVGVVKDFHTTSLHSEIKPLIIVPYPSTQLMNNIYVKINGERTQEAIAYLHSSFSEIAPDLPLNYSFMDNKIMELYEAEATWNTIFSYASIIGIFIACMGLFGLTTLSGVKQKKEIGIRKICGADIKHILFRMIKEFLKPVSAGLILAIPLAYYLSNQWLSNFSYRYDQEISMYASAIGLALLIALVTISWQSIKAALLNPVECIRNE